MIIWINTLEFFNYATTESVLVFDAKINHNIEGNLFSFLIDAKAVNLTDMIVH